jgi:hypothetical protein
VESSEEDLAAKRELFVATLAKATALLGPNAFRMPSRDGQRMILSRPLYDAVMVALARMRDQWGVLLDSDAAINAMDQLKQPEAASYELLVARANTAAAIRERIQLVRGALTAVVS